MIASANLRGAAWMIGSCVAATLMSSGIHGLAGEINSIQTTFLRSLIGLVLVFPLLCKLGFGILATQRWKLHLGRGLLGVVALNCGYYSITVLPLATVSVLFFTVPLFVTVLAPPMLGEHVGVRRWAATLIGLLGAAFVVGANPVGFDPNMLVALLASVLFAVHLVLGKQLSASERPLTILFYFSFVATVCSLPAAVVVWTPPDDTQWLILLFVGVVATARTYCDIRSYAAGEASFVAPFAYIRLLLMAAAGYLLFAEVPTTTSLVGAVIIILCTLYIARREAKIRSRMAPTLQPADDLANPPLKQQ